MLERHPLPEYPFCRADKIFQISLSDLYLAISVPCFFRKNYKSYPDKMAFCRCGKTAHVAFLPHRKRDFTSFVRLFYRDNKYFFKFDPGPG